ncbi:hypothetical protein AAVH_24286 [Aphelenchoides avenae]|nr:hypothetical protein AAVH_24286 [Aphelenchus avenae]
MWFDFYRELHMDATAMRTLLVFIVFCLFPFVAARDKTPAELEKLSELAELQQRLHAAKDRLSALDEFREKENLEEAVRTATQELHNLDPDNQPTVLTRDPRNLEDSHGRPSMYLAPSKAAADPFDGPVWIQPGEDFRVTTAEDNLFAPSATPQYILEFSPLPPGVGVQILS